MNSTVAQLQVDIVQNEIADDVESTAGDLADANLEDQIVNLQNQLDALDYATPSDISALSTESADGDTALQADIDQNEE